MAIMAEWIEKRMDEVADFNPRESLKRDALQKKLQWINCNHSVGMFQTLKWSHSQEEQSLEIMIHYGSHYSMP